MDQAPAGDPLVSGAAAAAAAAAAPEAPAVPSAAEGNITAPATASNPATTSTPAEAVNDPGATSFSWLDPHPEFVMILVGPNEVPFGLQTDFLRAKSSHYRKKLAGTDKFEAIERLPNCQFEVFALVQNFLYTGMVMPGDKTVPTYDILVGVWNQGHELGIDGLCDSTLDAMVEVRSATARIPAAPLLEQVWKTTPKGCSLRKLLLGWSAEYMRTSVSKAEFADSLPREVLSELVLVMVKSDTTPVVQLGGDSNHPNPTHPPRKQVHYLDQDEEEEPEPLYPVVKKPRRSEPSPHAPSASKAAVRKPRTSLPAPKPAPRRRSNATANGDQDFTTPQKLFFCSDLLTRMLSGPGKFQVTISPIAFCAARV